MGKKSKQIEGQLDLFAMMEQMAATAFAECSSCWCRDCKHNSRNEGVPRDLCGTMMACPACDGCISSGKAEICEIGSAANGCRVRAEEEGQ